jgi:dTDP-4-amino-4,6-dideoxygalactose transaminase
MFRRIPVIGHPITLQDLCAAFMGIFDKDIQSKFSKNLLPLTNSDYIFFANSGIASFYMILQALKNNSTKYEVILPAYTAPSLVVAVRKTGLKPILCDISLEDFNADAEDIFKRINQNTLCIVGVHMFGVPWIKIKDIKQSIPQGIFIVEDCAQAFGAKIGGSPVGNFGDIGFYSFNRGKNFPTYEGGCIVTNSLDFAEKIEDEMMHLKTCGVLSQLFLGAKLMAIALAFRPFFYSLLYPLIMQFKDNKVPFDFAIKGYTCLQAAFGNALLKTIDISFQKRLKNGMELIRALKSCEGVMLPYWKEQEVFENLPVSLTQKLRYVYASHRS